jgi:predicted HicB family RNase H-like nuclease
MADEKREAAISLRTFPSLKEWVEAQAKAEGRTVAQWVERALMAMRDGRSETQTPAKPKRS